MPNVSRAIILAAAASLAATPALAQSSDPAWLDELSNQLAVEKDCAVEYYINIQEGQLGARQTYEARAQCRDGRQFDGFRTEPEILFTIEQCGVQVC
ncbi:hypothetical protein [Oricola sp.]|uniref:hypothetical protein n=1 Tax=Oricola sp. TaxID=1979950 RepID=UPI003BAD8738